MELHLGQREYDFGEGGKVTIAGNFVHNDMFEALQALGPMGARIARYINNMKALMQDKDGLILELKGGRTNEQIAEEEQELQLSAHRKEFAAAKTPRVATPDAPRRKPKTWVFDDSHTPGPWRMSRSGMIRMGNDWICAVTARNRIYNGPLIEAAPDMLVMIERMLSSTSPQEARTIITDATALVEKAKTPAWERRPPPA